MMRGSGHPVCVWMVRIGMSITCIECCGGLTDYASKGILGSLLNVISGITPQFHFSVLYVHVLTQSLGTVEI